jgi:hypothetical protein
MFIKFKHELNGSIFFWDYNNFIEIKINCDNEFKINKIL